MDCWNKDCPVTSSADKTVRRWKIKDDTHLVFRGHKGNVDAVQIVTSDSIISSGSDGNLSLWKETQKKPVAHVYAAHGYDFDIQHGNPRWVSSLASVKMSNLVASGSHNGEIKLWHADADNHQLYEIGSLPCLGFINSLSLSPRLLVAGTGSEHRMGRWWHLKGPLNKVILYKLPDLDTLGSSSIPENDLNNDDSDFSSDDTNSFA